MLPINNFDAIFKSPNPGCEETYSEAIHRLRNQQLPHSNSDIKVVILGAGPAGLIRAITSLIHGSPTCIIEKRSENDPKRENTVTLDYTTIQQLKRFGVYQFLVENKLIYPLVSPQLEEPSEIEIHVRLGDLENGLKAVLQELYPRQEILYNTRVTEVHEEFHYLALTIESTDEKRTIIDNVGILVNAEGSQSSTNRLLGIERIQVLPPMPALVTIFKDNRPKIQGIGSLFRYIKSGSGYAMKSSYYHSLFLLNYLFRPSSRKNFCAIMLQTPGQVYVGCGLSPSIHRQISDLKQVVAEKKKAFKETDCLTEKNRYQKELTRSQKKYDSFLKKQANLSLCVANFESLRSLSWKNTSPLHFSLNKCEMIQIRCDRIADFALKVNESVILIAGDAAATVDPSTGLGCNTALQSNKEFETFLEEGKGVGIDISHGMPLKTMERRLNDYNRDLGNRVEYMHYQSTIMRKNLEKWHF